MRGFWIAALVGFAVGGTQSLGAQAAGVPADASARCKDGTYSTSTTAQGACSSHGGVSEWLATARCADGALSASRTSSGTCSGHGGVAEWLATAVCKDGTLSRAKARRGACSGHGGVAEWLGEQAKP